MILVLPFQPYEADPKKPPCCGKPDQSEFSPAKLI
jgi:hypothetical protein